MYIEKIKLTSETILVKWADIPMKRASLIFSIWPKLQWFYLKENCF